MSTPLKSRVSVPRLRDNKIDGVKYNRSSSKRNNFEMFAWLGMRLSGVVLVVLIFGSKKFDYISIIGELNVCVNDRIK